MTDPMQKAQALGRLLGQPVVSWLRQQDASPTAGTDPLPLYVAVVSCKVTEVMLVLGGPYVGAPAGATLQVAHMRGGAQLGLFDATFDPAWADAKTVVAAPGWLLEPDDLLVATVTKNAAGVLLPSLLLRITLEP